MHSDQPSGSGHQSPGLWRLPDDQSHRFNDVDHWTDLAKLLEKGKIHGIFIADVLGKCSQPRFDALSLLSKCP